MTYLGHRAVPTQTDIKYGNLHGLHTDCLQGSRFPCLLFLAPRNHLPSLAWGSFLTQCSPYSVFGILPSLALAPGSRVPLQ